MILNTSSGQKITLGAEFNRGGEGVIYHVQEHSDLLAKIYLHPHAGQENKIAWMCRNVPQDPTRSRGHASLAWPIDLLIDEKGRFVGYIMPFIHDAHPILEVFNPLRRNQVFPDFNLKYMHRVGRNLAAALAALHVRGYVVGDLNESNILVTSTAMVTLIDTDSFQVQEPRKDRIMVYPCPVGKPEYTPPELQGNAFWGALRRPEHDSFALGVIIFQLLMNGSHPFRSRWLGAGEPPPIEDKIRRGYYPYIRSLRPVCVPPPNTPSINHLHPSLVKMMVRCFVEGIMDNRNRPTAREWEQVLVEAESSLVQCRNKHFYCGLLRTGRIIYCPECRDSLRPGRLVQQVISSVVRRMEVSNEQIKNPSTKKSSRVLVNIWRKNAFTIVAVLLLGISVSASFWADSDRLDPAEQAAVRPAKPAISTAEEKPLTPLPTQKVQLQVTPQTDQLFTGGNKAPLFTVVGFKPSIQLGGVSTDKGGDAKAQESDGNQQKSAGTPNTNEKLLRRATRTRSQKPKQTFITQDNAGQLALRTMLAGHPSGLTCLCYSPVGNYLVSCSEMAEIRFWETRDWSISKTKGVEMVAGCVTFSPDGKVLAAGTRDHSIRVWRLKDGENIQTLTGHTEAITDLIFSSDGNLVASGSADNTVRIWRLKDGRLLQLLKGHWGDVTGLVFSPNDELLVSGSKDNTVRIWRVQDGKLVKKLRAHTRDITSIAFSSDGGWLATGSRDRSVKLWHAGNMINRLKGHDKAITCVVFSPDGKLVATGSDDRTVRIWNSQDGKHLATLGGCTKAVKGISFSPDGSSLAVGCEDGTIQIWGLP